MIELKSTAAIHNYYSEIRSRTQPDQGDLMLIFPINTETFKKSFLSGDGQIELQSDQDMWLTLIATGGKFLPTVARVAGVNFKFANEEKFRFGREGGMRLSVGAGAGAEIRLIWPDEDDETLKALG